MSFQEERFSVGSDSIVPTTVGHIPDISVKSYGKVDFKYCYYYPTKYGMIYFVFKSDCKLLISFIDF